MHFENSLYLCFPQSFQSGWRPEGKCILAYSAHLWMNTLAWCATGLKWHSLNVKLPLIIAHSWLQSALCNFMFKRIRFIWVMHCELAKHHWFVKWVVCRMELLFFILFCNALHNHKNHISDLPEKCRYIQFHCQSSWEPLAQQITIWIARCHELLCVIGCF